jgi:hypothetical protein
MSITGVDWLRKHPLQILSYYAASSAHLSLDSSFRICSSKVP